MAQAQYDLNIRDYWRVFKKRRFIILFSFTSVVVATAVFNNLQIPIYEAGASVRIRVQTTAIAALTDKFYRPYRDILASEEQIINSGPIMEEAAKRLKLVRAEATRQEIDEIVSSLSSRLYTERIPSAEMIAIRMQSSNPTEARDVANAVVEAYIEDNFKRENKEVKQAREFIEKQMQTVGRRLRRAEENLKVFQEREVVSGIAMALTARLADLQAQLSTLLTKATEKHPEAIRLQEQIKEVQDKLRQLPATDLEFVRLKRDVETHEQLYKMLRQRFEEARIVEGSQVAKAELVTPAVEPRVPVKPNKRFALIIGSIIGLMISLILAFLVESMDTSIGTIEDVENTLKLPVLTVIPSVKSEGGERTKGWFFGGKAISKVEKEEEMLQIGLIVHLRPMSQMAEAFRSLRTNLKLSGGKKVLVITSAGPREGKTTITCGLGISLAQMGIKTLLIDADLRRPTINKLLGIERGVGLNEIVSGKIKMEQALKGLTDIMMGKLGFEAALKTPGLDNLFALTSGHITSTPSEILSSEAMSNLIEDAKSRFDAVLIDVPPVLSISDAAIIAPKCDGIILVYEMGRTARSALLRSKTQLEAVGAKVLGVALNHISPDTYLDASYYPYYYHYKYRYYGREEDKEEGKASKGKEPA